MRTRLACLAGIGLLLGADRPTDAVRAEKGKLKGTWVLEEVRLGRIDAKAPKEVRKPGAEGWLDARLTFAGDRVTVEGWGAPEPATKSYALDPAKKPKELDIGRGASRTEYIYMLDGERLVVAFPFPELVAGGTFAERQRHTRRPRAFKETTETAPPVIWVLKRVKR